MSRRVIDLGPELQVPGTGTHKKEKSKNMLEVSLSEAKYKKEVSWSSRKKWSRRRLQRTSKDEQSNEPGGKYYRHHEHPRARKPSQHEMQERTPVQATLSKNQAGGTS